MRRVSKFRLDRFRKSERGTATIEFVIWFPLFLILLLSSVELGMITVRQTMLERSLDEVVRNIRLSTGTSPKPTADDIKNDICSLGASLIPGCASSLTLEMRREDPRNWTPLDRVADCKDYSDDPNNAPAFESGDQNQLMVLRACARFKPFFPTTALGRELADDSGNAALIATSAFVLEPR